MDKKLVTSRFFTVDDKRIDKVVFPLPTYWWSRFYEYAWASEFCRKTDVVLDAACGIPHPFKFYLSHHSKVIYAVDKDERIEDFSKIIDEIEKVYGNDAVRDYPENLDNPIKYRQASITALPYKNGMFDKIFCISALEHMTDEKKLEALKEFNRTLKKSGMVILTLDYPDTTIEKMESIANEAGLKLAGEKDMTIPQNAIHWEHKLYCFRMVLVKGKDSGGENK